MDTDSVHAQLLGRTIETSRDHKRAVSLYTDLVTQGDADDTNFWRQRLQGQIFLGDDRFAERMRRAVASPRKQQASIPKAQRLVVRTWAQWLALCKGDRDQALARAHREGGMTMTGLASELGYSISHVSRLIRGVGQAEASGLHVKRET